MKPHHEILLAQIRTELVTTPELAAHITNAMIAGLEDVTELVEALEKLARLGNGEHYGNSDGNMLARTALSKYKGAK